ncbi:type VII secretion integral membrane protein EccD [Rhodococcus sp. HNM0569]|uniref:type VII secretion integral membrane protein EccD n=1 Tax=Rhodococcus sp. HNM0569 TaxID=2716340 RepID=UPI00146C52DC|nr:type VII secretion integral membrane protein EccD [Rhodococcus sp. HNM0569]NLU81761.1 type VII secretion integral membrane protein EccD [Rhodococcus sp. HNM0569]
MTITRDESRHAQTGRKSVAADLCRLTILSEHSQVDLAVPFAVPLAILIPGIVDTIRNHHRDNDFDHSAEQYEPSEWVLAKIGQAPLSSTLTLHEHGIRDGDLLVLESADNTAPPPLFDDIMYSVALADADKDREWSPAWARRLGSIGALALSTMSSLALVWSEAGENGFVAAIATLVTALLFLVAGAVTGRVYADAASSLVLGTCAIPPALAAGMLFVPGDPGAPHVLLGAALVAVTSVLAVRLSGVGLTTFTTAAVVASVTVIAALVATLFDAAGTHEVGAGVAAGGLIVLALSARISILFAKIPLPPVPAPGTSVDPSEDDPDDERRTLSFDALTERAARARNYLTGLVLAGTILTVAGAALAARGENAGEVYWPGVCLALSCTVVLLFRGRTYSSVKQAAPLVGGGIVLLTVLLAGAALTSSLYAIGVYAIAFACVIGALTLGFVVPQQSFSPVMRRAAELLDLAFIASVIPLVCWVTGLYLLMRGL